MEKIKYLLDHVRVINDKYKKIAVAKGENFNLFDIMGMRTDEVKTHSAIIAELLNPKGSHDMGAVFLKLFLQKLIQIITQPNDKEKHEYLLNCNLSKTQAIVEFNIGQISKDQTEGGRIDILLLNDEFEICIENKIYAGDQSFQLRRYHNHLTKKNKTTLLIYLTLEGKSACIESTCNRNKNNEGIWPKDESEVLEANKDYLCISYQSEVLSWLEECHSLAADKPILRESLKQYILLIRSLTNQATNNDMAKEIHDVILTDISSAAQINGEFDNAIKYISTKMRDAVTAQLQQEYKNAKIENEGSGNPFSCIYVWFKNEQKHFGIESFNRKSILDKKDEKGTDTFLFIGQMDWGGKVNGRTDIVKGVWIENTILPIWNKKELDEKLQKFSQGDERVITELVHEIKEYIDDNLKIIY